MLVVQHYPYKYKRSVLMARCVLFVHISGGKRDSHVAIPRDTMGAT